LVRPGKALTGGFYERGEAPAEGDLRRGGTTGWRACANSVGFTKLNELLKKNGLTRHNLPKVMAKIEMQRMAAEEAAAAATRAAGWKKGPDANDLGIPRTAETNGALRPAYRADATAQTFGGRAMCGAMGHRLPHRKTSGTSPLM
jgi:hypothetical protein